MDTSERFLGKERIERSEIAALEYNPGGSDG